MFSHESNKRSLLRILILYQDRIKNSYYIAILKLGRQSNKKGVNTIEGKNVILQGSSNNNHIY